MFSYSEFEHNYTKSLPNFKYVEPISEDYRVFVNGKEVPVYTCRISKWPFNRVWTGYQRPFDQSEQASFVNLVSDEPLQIEVIANRSHQKVMIKPYSKKISHTETDRKIAFTLPENGQFVLETDSYHRCLYIFNSQPIAAPSPDAVTHYFGPGIHMPGKIVLRDNDSVYVDKDALVFGCLYAENAKNLHIFGNGIFDDSAEARYTIQCYEDFTNGNLKFYDCEHVRIEGVGFKNSAIWCINLFHCFDVGIEDMKVFGQWRYNTDGVDIVNSQDIVIRNSFVHSFDDTITVKGIDRYCTTDNKNMLFENCVLWCDWGRCCEIGLETACREYKNITFRNCDILRGGYAALDIQNGDWAEVSDITFEDIRIEYNAFDTEAVYQAADEMTYIAQDTVTAPCILSIANERFRSEDTENAWGDLGQKPDELDLTGIQVAGVHDITVKNIYVYYDEAIPKVDGKYNARIDIHSSVEGVEFDNIYVSGVVINGKFVRGEEIVQSVSNVSRYVFEQEDAYAQTKKNTVKAYNQLKKSEFVRFVNAGGSGPRVMFVGNSITLHGVKEDIGWYNEWGMAASAQEKDYVHCLMADIQKINADAAFCICQVAVWETQYDHGTDTHSYYKMAKEFDADIIVMRFIENCPYDGFQADVFKKELGELLAYLNNTGKAKMIITTGFWRHPGDVAICEFAKENGLPLVELGDLGEDDRMKAIGLFEHSGVANHPGDLGMKKIAERIFEQLKMLL